MTDTTLDDREPFREWAILELMGHRKLAGLVTEQEIGGSKLIRIDVPGADGNVATQFYGSAAVYCMTPVAEELARKVARSYQPEPVTRWDLPKQIEAPVRATLRDYGVDDEDDGGPM